MTIIGLAVVWDDEAVVLAATGGSRRGPLRMITKQQYRKMMSEYQATGNITNSALKAAMSRPTARKYVTAAQPPQELQTKHGWRTRKDPLVEIWLYSDNYFWCPVASIRNVTKTEPCLEHYFLGCLPCCLTG